MSSEQLLPVVSKRGRNDDNTEPNNNNNYGAIDKEKENDNNKNDAVACTTTTKITYMGLLSQNKNFLFYWLSFVVNRMVR